MSAAWSASSTAPSSIGWDCRAVAGRRAATYPINRLALCRRQVATLIMPPGYCWPDGLTIGREFSRRLRTVATSTAPHTTVTTSPPPTENTPIRWL